jgi:hypothetical protein
VTYAIIIALLLASILFGLAAVFEAEACRREQEKIAKRIERRRT